MSALSKTTPRLPEIDLAVRQALDDLRAAHRRLKELQRIDNAARSVAQQSLDRRARNRARACIAAAHKQLDELLSEDA